MFTENAYYWMKSVLDNDTCNKIIDLGLSKVPKTATTKGNLHKKTEKTLSLEDKTLEDIGYSDHLFDIGEKKDYHIRDSEVSWLNNDWLYDKIIPLLNEANYKAGWKFNIDSFEQFQFTKYNSPGGFYGWHNDSAGDHYSVYKRFIPGVIPYDEKGNIPSGYVTDKNLVNKVRKLSVTINLCDKHEYEGGNLKFDFGPHSEKERFHECVEIRPKGSMIVFPSFIHHQVTPVTKGTRYSLVLWACGRPFK